MQDLPMAGPWPALWVALTFVAVTGAALAARSASLASLRRWPGESLVSRVAMAIRGPSWLWCALVGVYVANDIALDRSLLATHWHDRVTMLIEAAFVASMTVPLAAISGEAIARVGERALLGGGITGLARTTGRVVVLAVGLLVFLSTLGVQIAPLLAALGVGGLAVALALQDTLANLFAGVHLLADRPIRVGDYVKVSDAGEGYVDDIGWRSTRIRTPANAIMVVPNQAVAKATITNWSMPDSRVSLGLRVSVDYSADPGRVETILLEEVTQALDHVPGLLREPPPGVSLIPGFGESSLDFTIGYSVASFVDQYRAQHEIRRRVLERFGKEGLSMAVPVRTVRVESGAGDGRPAGAGASPGRLRGGRG